MAPLMVARGPHKRSRWQSKQAVATATAIPAATSMITAERSLRGPPRTHAHRGKRVRLEHPIWIPCRMLPTATRLEIRAVSLEFERPAAPCDFAAIPLDGSHAVSVVVAGSDAEVPVAD